MGEGGGRSLGVLTSGGDAPGMNAAVRAVVRTALDRGVPVWGIREGYQGLVRGGDQIQPLGWDDVGGILQRGGTEIGSARSEAFRTPDGRREAVAHLIERDIEALVVIGGDGSLTGADLLRREWSEHLAALVAAGRVPAARAERHERLTIVGLVGSIDNDMAGTDVTIGADTALHRITEAIDAISSTAASHQRTFLVEVMGRRCGYLALMSALATAADWVLIPESPPDVEDWKETMCQRLLAGRAAGRRASIVVVAEGAIDRDGKPIPVREVVEALEERLGQEVRVTTLGHVQRGGRPTAFDRNMSTFLGHAAAEEALDESIRGQARMIGLAENRIVRRPLLECVRETQAVAEAIEARAYEKVLALRGAGFADAFRTLRTLARALPHAPPAGRRRLRIAVLCAGAPAPGMNMAVRVAVRLGLDRGHVMFGVRHGFEGLVGGQVLPLDWMSVNGWASRGGAELGTSRHVPRGRDHYAIARTLEANGIDGLLVIGGYEGYESAHGLLELRETFPAFDVPIACVPASIDNNLPGSEISVGSDTALNTVVRAVDAIKQYAGATRRVFVVEVMGARCGYLAFMSGVATGAERVYLPEEGVTLKDMEADLADLVEGFHRGKRLGVVIRNERANAVYDTGFMTALFEEEGGNLFQVRSSILGHMQQGGDPTPFDRNLATRLTGRAIGRLDEAGLAGRSDAVFVGVERARIGFRELADLPRLLDPENRRPWEQWWLALRPLVRVMSQPGPRASPTAPPPAG